MATKRKFKSKATSSAFKSIGQSLQASRGEIERKTRADVDALKLSKIQSDEAARLQIGGLADAARFEEGVLKVKHDLEQKVRTTKYEAVKKKAETDVDRLRGEAEEKKKYAEHLAQLAPKRAKMVSELAGAGFKLADTFQGINQFKALKESGYLKSLTDGKASQHYKLVWNAQKSAYEISHEDPEGANALIDGTIRLSSHFAKQKFLSWVKNNKGQLRADVIKDFEGNESSRVTGEKDNDPYKYGFSNASEVQELGGLAILEKLGISSTSKVGADIIEEFSKMGALDTKNFYEDGQVEKTSARIIDLREQFKSAQGVREKSLTYNNLVLAYHTGWFKEGGGIQDPTKGEGLSIGDANIQAIKDLISNDKSIDSRDKIDKLLEGLPILGAQMKEWTTDMDEDEPLYKDSDLWLNKASKRIEEEVYPHLDTVVKNRDNAKKEEREANGIVFVGEQEKKKAEVQADPKGDYSEERLKALEAIKKNGDISDKQRKLAYKVWKYNPEDYNDLGNYINFRRAVDDSNEAGWIKAYDSMSAKGKEAAAREFKLLRDLRETIPKFKGKDPGLASLREMLKVNLASKDEGIVAGRKTLSLSGELAHEESVVDYLNEFDSTAGAPNEKRHKDAYATINAEIDAARDKKNPKSKTSKYRIERPGFGLSVPGVYQQSIIYPHFLDRDQQDVLAVEKWSAAQDLSDTEKEDLDPKTPGIQIKTLDDNTILYGPEKEVWEHTRLVSPDESKLFLSKLEEDYYNPGAYDDLTEFAPRGLQAFALRTGKTITEVINDYYGEGGPKGHIYNQDSTLRKDEKYTVRLSANGQDAAKINNDGVAIHPRNMVGSNAWNAAYNQTGKVPMRPWVSESLDLGISPLEGWMKTNDIAMDSSIGGKTQLSDPEAFLRNGGAQFMTEDLAISLGLDNWDPTVGWVYGDAERTTRLKKMRSNK